MSEIIERQIIASELRVKEDGDLEKSVGEDKGGQEIGVKRFREIVGESESVSSVGIEGDE